MKFILLFLPLLACGDALPPPRVVRTVVTASGTLRYQADSRRLTVTMELPDSSATAPTFRGQMMQALGGMPARRFRYEALTDFPSSAQIGLQQGERLVEFSLVTHPVSIDSLPDTIAHQRAVNFPIGDRGLTDRESLVVFFEPEDRARRARRILVTGPTASETVSLPSSATGDIEPGRYDVYLVKQRLFNDQIGNLRLSLQTEYFTRPREVVVE